jgi:hypothetical protein
MNVFARIKPEIRTTTTPTESNPVVIAVWSSKPISLEDDESVKPH